LLLAGAKAHRPAQAGEVGSAAVDTVRKAVTKPIKGVKVVLKEPALAKAA